MPDLPRVFWSIPDLTDIPWFLEPWRPPLFTKLSVRTGFRKEDFRPKTDFCIAGIEERGCFLQVGAGVEQALRWTT